VSDVHWIPRIGDEYAGYRLVSLIGHGGMSIVYKAEHIKLERTVALKLLSPQLSEDEDFRERFQRESKVAAALEHPNIIPIYEAGDENGVFYIAMRYVDGADLKTRLKQDGPLDAAQVASLVSQVAAALEAAHEKGLIHRDVKPANILIAVGAGVEGSDHAYLSDFGVAKNTAAAGFTKTGLFVGTADYASPEQIEGRELDGRADVYSLGCVTYEALTATPTYEKDSEVAMMYAHLLEPPPKLTEKRPDLSPEVDEVIAKAVAKSKEDRYARPTDFAVALKQAVAAGAVGAAAAAPQPGGGETVLAGTPAAAAVAAAASSSADAADRARRKRGSE
jgi:serine/threonine-protein kinase